MDYQKIYNQIIKRAKEETNIRLERKKSGEYFEGHHILARCLGGEGKANHWKHENIVGLTAREHFLCHWLLVRIHPTNNKLAHAFWMMCSWKREYQNRVVPNSRIYEEAKSVIAKIVSRRFKNTHLTQERKDNLSFKNKGQKRSVEFGISSTLRQKGKVGTHKGWVTVTNGKEEKRIPSIEECPRGWKKGRKDSARSNISKVQLGRTTSQQTKDKMSKSAIEHWSTNDRWNKGLTYKIKK